MTNALSGKVNFLTSIAGFLPYVDISGLVIT